MMRRTKSQLIEEIERLKALNQQLEESKAHFENALKQNKELNRLLDEIVDHMPGMGYQCLNDEDWTMVYVTDDCYDLTGYKPVELIGNWTISYNQLIHPDDRDYVWKEVETAVAQKEKFRMKYRLITAEGKEKQVWEIGMGIYDNDGKLEKIQGFISDIKID